MIAPINESNRVGRYFSIEGFLSFLESRQLHFTRLDQFTDAAEGMQNTELSLLKIKALEKMVNSGFGHMPGLYSERAKENFQKNLEYRKRVYASCWTYQLHESHALWNLYTNQGRGVLFYCDLPHLVNAVNNNSIEHSKVEYRKSDADLTETTSREAIVLKKKYFDGENEYRFYIDENVNQIPTCATQTERGYLMPISIDLEKTGLYFGYGLDAWTLKSLKSLITTIGYPEQNIALSEINWTANKATHLI